MIDLTEQHLKIPHALARKYAGGNQQLAEELVSIGNLALVEAAHNYRADAGAVFGTWAYTCVRGRMLASISGKTPASDAHWKRRIPSSLDEPLSRMDDVGTLSETVADDGRRDSCLPPEGCLAEVFGSASQVSRIKRIIGVTNYEVLRIVLLDGIPAAEIVRRLGWDHRTVWTKIYELIGRLNRGRKPFSAANVSRRQIASARYKGTAIVPRIAAVHLDGTLHVSLWYMVNRAERVVAGPCGKKKPMTTGAALGWPGLCDAPAKALVALVDAERPLTFVELRERTGLRDICRVLQDLCESGLVERRVAVSRAGVPATTNGRGSVVCTSTPKALAERGPVSPYAPVLGKDAQPLVAAGYSIRPWKGDEP